MHNLNKYVREYFDRVTDHGFSVPHCESCDSSFLPPRALCPTCGSDSLGWQECVLPEGEIYSLTRMPSGKTVALVDLAVVEGPGRLYVEIIGEQATSAEIGDTVVVSTRKQEFELGEWVPVVVVGEQTK